MRPGATLAGWTRPWRSDGGWYSRRASTVSFVLCLGSSIWVLLPHEFVFAFGGREFRQEVDHGMRDVADAYRVVVRWMEPALRANRSELAKLTSWLTLSCLLLAIEIILWTTSLIG